MLLRSSLVLILLISTAHADDNDDTLYDQNARELREIDEDQYPVFRNDYTHPYLKKYQKYLEEAKRENRQREME